VGKGRKWENENLRDIVKRLAKTENWPEPQLPCDYLVFDLETLGFDPARDMIVQLGFCLVRDCEVVHDLWDTDSSAMILKWPAECFEGRDGAINVHGITPEKSAAEGVDPDEVFGIVEDVVAYANKEGMQFCGHNLFAFDHGFLKRAMSDRGKKMDISQDSLIDTAMIVKAMQLGMKPDVDERAYSYYARVKQFRARGVYYNLDRHCVKRFGLDAKHGVDPDAAHDAGYDCWMTHLVVEELNKIIRGEAE
jgi:DNA polymerase III epsilon subunit-like protein